MNERFVFQIVRAVFTIILAIYAVIFFGVLSAGFINLRTVVGLIDYVYAFIYMGLGTLIVVLLLTRLRWLLKNLKKFEKTSKKRISFYLAATLIVIGMYFLRHTLPSLILYAGFLIGSFFIKVARNAYNFLFGVDLYRYQLEWFAWVFQWQYVYALLELFGGFFKKKR